MVKPLRRRRSGLEVALLDQPRISRVLAMARRISSGWVPQPPLARLRLPSRACRSATLADSSGFSRWSPKALGWLAFGMHGGEIRDEKAHLASAPPGRLCAAGR